jgi:hypothetical protein
MRLWKTDYNLEEILRLFKEEADIEISEHDYTKINEALWIINNEEENSPN